MSRGAQVALQPRVPLAPPHRKQQQPAPLAIPILIVLLVLLILVAIGAITPPKERGLVCNFVPQLTRPLSLIVPALTLATRYLRVQVVFPVNALIVKESLLPLDIPLEPIAPIKHLVVIRQVAVILPRVLRKSSQLPRGVPSPRIVPNTVTASPAQANQPQPTHAIGAKTIPELGPAM